MEKILLKREGIAADRNCSRDSEERSDLVGIVEGRKRKYLGLKLGFTSQCCHSIGV